MEMFSAVKIQQIFNLLQENETCTFETDLVSQPCHISLSVLLQYKTMSFYLILASEKWTYIDAIGDVINVPILLQDMLDLFQIDSNTKQWFISNKNVQFNIGE